MLKKYGKTIFFILLVIFLASAVSAAEDIEIDSMPHKQASEIQTAINGAPADSVVYLNNTYYSDGSSSISISKDNLIIDGSSKDEKGYSVIDGKNTNWHVQVNYVTATFRNIKFINMKFSSNGGAISSWGGASRSLTLINCSFINCSNTNNYGQGGAVSSSAPITMSNCYFEKCSSGKYGEGGSVYCTSSVYMNGCTFVNSSAPGDHGGAVYSEKEVHIKNSSFISCTAPEYHGGAVFAVGDLTVADSSFINCSADNSGAIKSQANIVANNTLFEDCISTLSDSAAVFALDNVTINDCSFIRCNGRYNAVSSYRGTLRVNNADFINCSCDSSGAALSTDSGTIIVNGSSFINCKAVNNGGVIQSRGTNPMEISNSIFVNCTTRIDNGGAIYTKGDLTVVNCTFTDVSSRKDGGAIRSDSGIVNISGSIFKNIRGSMSGAVSAVKDVYVRDSTFVNCTSGSTGGAIYTYSSVYADNVNFTNCTASVGGAIWSFYSNAVISVNNSNFVNCRATYNDGGAIMSRGNYKYGGLVSVINCSFTNATAVRNGGATVQAKATFIWKVLLSLTVPLHTVAEFTLQSTTMIALSTVPLPIVTEPPMALQYTPSPILHYWILYLTAMM